MTHRHDGPAASAHALAQGLGWFSIGLGLAEFLAPERLARSLGMEERAGLIRAYGVREIATGLGILLQERNPAPWIWGRVAGDAVDLATLASGLAGGGNPRRENVGLALAAVAGVTVLDLVCARQLAADGEERPRRQLPPGQRPDYRDRSGLPRPPDAMRGAARDAEIPPDMRVPEALRPYASA